MNIVGIPSVSVVIPVFNRAQMVIEAVQTVLSQDGVQVELVLVDDGSTDGTAQVIDQLASNDERVRALHQDNAGPSAARNAGVTASSAPLVAFLDSDDLMAPACLARLIEALHATAGAEIVIGKESTVILDGAEVPRLIALRGTPMTEPFWNVMTMVLTRPLWDDLGGFDESMRLGEDTDLYARIVSAGHVIAKLDEPVIFRRVSGDNLVYGLPDDNAMLSMVRRHRQSRANT